MLPRRYLPAIPALMALEAVDRLGTASAAAEELSLTQGAISRALQGLEAQLGVPLLVRERQRMRRDAWYAGSFSWGAGLVHGAP